MKQENTKARVLDAFKNHAKMDAYAVARKTGLSPMAAGRTMLKLAEEGELVAEGVLGSANDLACEMRLSA